MSTSPQEIERSPVKPALPSARAARNCFFGNNENLSELSNKDGTGTEPICTSESSEEISSNVNPFGNHIRVSKSPVPPLRIP